jgi:phosphate:Na+ symporter
MFSSRDDLELARQLLAQKTTIRDKERRSIALHFERISNGATQSIDASSLHLDILRDLKRINSHLTSVAYPILERAGELAESRLRKTRAG